MHDMIRLDYLQSGVYGLANAHRANTMAGHPGAAVLAGCFFIEDHPNLGGQTQAAIQHELDRIIRGDEAIWFDPVRTGLTFAELFEALPRQAPNEEAIPDIGLDLAQDIGQLRQSGHDVIFAALALRALHDHPELAEAPTISGVRKLIRAFRRQSQGRGYYGKERGWIKGEQVGLTRQSEIRPYHNEDDMADITIRELIASASVRKQGFGGLFHLIDHAAALLDLAQLGYRGLARQGLAAHHHHLRLWRSLPDVEPELGPLVRAKHYPTTAAYWRDELSGQWSAHLSHRIKSLYGLHRLLRAAGDADIRNQAEQAFLFLMG